MPSWNKDAQFATSINRKYIFASEKINKFIDSYEKFIVVASKGMGKTLLLRYKKQQVESEKSNIVTIPVNKTADYVELPVSPSKDLIASLHNFIFWEDLWKLSIAISILLNFPHRLNESDKRIARKELTRANLPEPLKDELDDAFSKSLIYRRTPSEVLDIFLQSGKKAIEKTRSTSLQLIRKLFLDYINNSCFVFIDSFDQALNKVFPDNLEVWCAAQHGLMTAAWELSRHNRHVKVFTSIRQEAWAAFTGAERANIDGSVLLIEYSHSDLENIFLTAISQYERIDTIEEFVGFPKIYNGYLRSRENIFDYICRHTINIPRWLMSIGSEISNSRSDRGIITDDKRRKKHTRKIADIVNRISAKEAYEYIRSQMRPFFRGDDPQVFLNNLLSKINSSVLTLSNIKRISEKFSNEQQTIRTKHPFCILYNLCLLGVVTRSPSSTKKIQVFKKPYEFDWNHENVLPLNPDSYYLIHPSLHYLIQDKNYKFNFNKVRIGDGITWTKTFDKRIEKEKVKLFISYSHNDWDEVSYIVKQIEDYLLDKSILHDIWLDRWSMKGGRWIQDQIVDGLTNSDFLIFMVSRNSLGSKPVAVEWKSKFKQKFSEGEDSIFPFIIDDTKFDELPEFLTNIFSYRYEDKSSIKRLVDDILFWKAEQVASPDRYSAGAP